MARARPIDLDAGDTYAAAAAKTISMRADELAEHSANVLDLSEIENLHDMRVATRRLRAALEVFEPCFPEKHYRRTLKRVKQLADALGERRDRDVAIEELTEFGRQVSRPDQRGLSALMSELRAEQASANDELAPQVTVDRVNDLRDHLVLLADGARGRMQSGADQ